MGPFCVYFCCSVVFCVYITTFIATYIRTEKEKSSAVQKGQVLSLVEISRRQQSPSY